MTELHFAMTEAIQSQVLERLFPIGNDDQSEHGVIGIVTTSTGRRRRTLLLHSLVPQQPGDVAWVPAAGLLYSPQYKSRAVDLALARQGAGLVFIHTHPLVTGHMFPRPSAADLFADSRDLYFLGQSLPSGVPLAAAVVGGNRLWSFRECSFSYPASSAEARSGKFGPNALSTQYASAVRVVGPGVRKTVSTSFSDTDEAVDVVSQDSTIQLWGRDGQARLASLRVGITGAGGVGGILAEHVARLGVGELVFLDFDRIHADNRNRSQGATRDDAAARELKVTVAERLARMAATHPKFSCVAISGSVVESESLPDLLDCDIILNAADSAWARQVLDHMSFAHLIPVINGGTGLPGNSATGQLITGKCEVSVTGPGHVCFECSLVYSRKDVTEAQEHPHIRGHRGYLWKPGEPIPPSLRAPSVIGANALVAGLMQLRLMALSLQTTPDVIVGTQRYYVTEGHAQLLRLPASCSEECERTSTTALGDLYRLPLGVDLDRKVADDDYARWAVEKSTRSQ